MGRGERERVPYVGSPASSLRREYVRDVRGKSAGLSGKDLSGFSTDLTGLVGDLSSFKGGTVEDAIVAIGSGVARSIGTDPEIPRPPRRRDAPREALELGLISTTTQALTPQQKVLVANAVIWEQTKDAGRRTRRRPRTPPRINRRSSPRESKTRRRRSGSAPPPRVADAPPDYLRDGGVPRGERCRSSSRSWGSSARSSSHSGRGTSRSTANPIGLIVVGIAVRIVGIVLLVKNWDTVAAVATVAWDKTTRAILFVWDWIKSNWPLPPRASSRVRSDSRSSGGLSATGTRSRDSLAGSSTRSGTSSGKLRRSSSCRSNGGERSDHEHRRRDQRRVHRR